MAAATGKERKKVIVLTDRQTDRQTAKLLLCRFAGGKSVFLIYYLGAPN